MCYRASAAKRNRRRFCDGWKRDSELSLAAPWADVTIVRAEDAAEHGVDCLKFL